MLLECLMLMRQEYTQCTGLLEWSERRAASQWEQQQAEKVWQQLCAAANLSANLADVVDSICSNFQSFSTLLVHVTNTDLPHETRHFVSLEERVHALFNPRTVPGELEIVAMCRVFKNYCHCGQEVQHHGEVRSGHFEAEAPMYTASVEDVGHYGCMVVTEDGHANSDQQDSPPTHSSKTSACTSQSNKGMPQLRMSSKFRTPSPQSNKAMPQLRLSSKFKTLSPQNSKVVTRLPLISKASSPPAQNIKVMTLLPLSIKVSGPFISEQPSIREQQLEQSSIPYQQSLQPSSLEQQLLQPTPFDQQGHLCSTPEHQGQHFSSQ